MTTETKDPSDQTNPTDLVDVALTEHCTVLLGEKVASTPMPTACWCAVLTKQR